MSQKKEERTGFRFLLGTNWKMYKTKAQTLEYMTGLKQLAAEHQAYQFFVMVPYTDLETTKTVIQTSNILFGAQNMHWLDEGPYTGEISPAMLAEIGVDMVQLGHSERRQWYNETDITVNYKVLAATQKGFVPLICIGEKAEDKQYQVTKQVIERQLKIATHNLNLSFGQRLIIAYEPIWSIGVDGIPAEADYVEQVHGQIRDFLGQRFGTELGQQIAIIYGGSVNLNNASALCQATNVDGLFIGRSAWDLEKFEQIIKRLERIESPEDRSQLS